MCIQVCVCAQVLFNCETLLSLDFIEWKGFYLFKQVAELNVCFCVYVCVCF